MEEKNSKKKKLIADIILALVLLAVSAALLVVINNSRDDGAIVVVTIDGEEIARYSLSENGEYSLNGGTNILVIKEGKAYIKEATCPDKVCVNMGGISLSGERIVCLPNKLMISLTSKN